MLFKRSLGDHVMGNWWTRDEQPLLTRRATSAQTKNPNLGNTTIIAHCSFLYLVDYIVCGIFCHFLLAILKITYICLANQPLGSFYFLFLSYLLRCYARMFLEITAEEAGVCKMIFPCHFLDALRTALELHLELQNHILVDDGLRRMVRYLAHDVRQILLFLEIFVSIILYWSFPPIHLV